MRDRSADDERHLRELEELTHEAFLKGDVESLDRILADGFISTGPDGTPATKADYIAANTSGLTFESIHTDDLQVRTFGDAAVTFGRVTMKGDPVKTLSTRRTPSRPPT
jgi:hypothetical protein